MPADSTWPLRACLIEDNDALREETVFGLRHLGIDAVGFPSAEVFYRELVGTHFDVAVIDVGLPGEDGFSVARHLRRADAMGIVMLSARGQLDDKLQGLKEADHYLVKPVDLEELSAVIASVHRLRRRGDADGGAGWALQADSWTLAGPGGRRWGLTASERLLMRALFEARGRPVARDALVQALGEDPYEYDHHRLDTLVSRLRKKVTADGDAFPLRAVRGTGYLFEPGPD